MKLFSVLCFILFSLNCILYCSRVPKENLVQEKAELFVKYNGPATMRLFGITIGKDSTMYIVGGDAAAIGKDGYVSKVTPDGKETLFVRFKSSFVGPGVDIDDNGNLFIAGGNNIYKISKEGKVDTLLSGFSGAFDIKLDLKGDMFIADHKENKIYKVTPKLEKEIFIDNHAASLGSFILGGLDFDKDYKYLYSIEVSKKLLKRYPINEDGTAGEPEIILSNAPAIFSFNIDKNGNLFSTDYNKAEFLKVDKDGKLNYISSKAGLRSAMGFCIGRNGFHENSLFVADAEGIKRIEIIDSTTTSIDIENTGTPTGFNVFPNYPNPFNPETTIRFSLLQSSNVQVNIFDSVGRNIRTILDENLSAGIHEAKWDGNTEAGMSAASGIYYYQVKTADEIRINKMVLLK